MDSDVGNALSVCARPRLLADGPGRWRWGTLAVYNAMRIPLRRDARPVPTGCTSRFEAASARLWHSSRPALRQGASRRRGGARRAASGRSDPVLARDLATDCRYSRNPPA